MCISLNFLTLRRTSAKPVSKLARENVIKVIDVIAVHEHAEGTLKQVPMAQYSHLLRSGR